MLESIVDFLHLFGSRYEYVQLIFLVLVLLLVRSFFKNRLAAVFISILLTVYLVLQLISLFFVKKFIGYAFYVHLNTRDIISMVGIYLKPLIYMALVVVVLYFLIYKSSHFSKKIWTRINGFKSDKIALISRFLLLFISIVMLSKKDGVFYRNYELISMLKVSSSDFESNLKTLGLENYQSPKSLTVTQGKNVIVLSLESIEKGFLHPRLNHLTPNLSSLANRWTYIDMNQNIGSSWTSGSLYTYMTGFPAFFGAESNDIFQGAYHSDVTSLIHVFNQANYETRFITADAQFSGTEDMLNAFGIDAVIDKTQLIDKVHDKDIFDVAKTYIQSKKDSKTPYALFVSSLDTHFPDGIYDERFESILKNQEDQLQFMVSVIDYIMGDFVSFLKEENLMENTVVYIFPDHLKMGDPSMFNATGERELYLLTNAQLNELGVQDSVTVNQIDLPKLILNGAGVEHNAKFFTDAIEGNKNAFIERNLNQITALNISGFQRLEQVDFEIPQESKLFNTYVNDTSRFIAHGGGLIDGYDYTNCLEAMNKSYGLGLRLFELDIIETSDGHYVAAHDWEKWKRQTDFKGETPVSLAEFKKHKIHKKYSPMAMEDINTWFKQHPNCTLVTDKVDAPSNFAAQFVDKDRLIMELFTLESVAEGLEAGILSAMPTQGVLESLGDEKLDWILDNNIKHVAISRRYIRDNKSFLLKLKENNVKAYAFHLNFDAGIDEEYVLKYELDYIYGIYSDYWDFQHLEL